MAGFPSLAAGQAEAIMSRSSARAISVLHVPLQFQPVHQKRSQKVMIVLTPRSEFLLPLSIINLFIVLKSAIFFHDDILTSPS